MQSRIALAKDMWGAQESKIWNVAGVWGPKSDGHFDYFNVVSGPWGEERLKNLWNGQILNE